MAEVRAIPSAVGAFEAQVLNMNKAYNFLMQNAAAERKQAAALRKQVEDDLYASLNDKRVIRAVDATYIEGLKKDAQDYFFQNKSKILQGGEAYNELRRKMGLVTNEVTRSMSAKEQQNQVDAYAKNVLENAEKGVDVGSQFKEGVAVVRLPLNDRRRTDYRFKNEIGEDVGIEQLSINELDRVAYFRPDRLKESIVKIPFTEANFEKLVKGKDVQTTYKVKSPYLISQAIVDTGRVYPGMESFYKKNMEAELIVFPDLQDRMNKALPNIISAYESAGASTPGSDFGSVAALFEKDGTPGIDINNPFEYALYKELEANLPMRIGVSYSYKSQANARAAESLNMERARNNAHLKELAEKKIGLDAYFVDKIKSGGFKSTEAMGIINAFIDQKEAALGGNISPARVVFDDTDKTMKLFTTRALFNPDGSFVNDRNTAEALLKGNTGYIVQIPGGYAIQQSKTFSIDKNSPSLGADFSSALDMAQDALIDATLKNTFGNIRKGGQKGAILK